MSSFTGIYETDEWTLEVSVSSSQEIKTCHDHVHHTAAVSSSQESQHHTAASKSLAVSEYKTAGKSYGFLAIAVMIINKQFVW